jgi:glycosyltransferase involved in cell wall biosynthesis
MNIAIVIPTFNRQKKLFRLLKSIEENEYPYKTVFIMADNKDYSTVDFVMKFDWNMKLCTGVSDDQKFVSGIWNYWFEKYYQMYDAALLLVDDVELYPNTIEEAVRGFKNTYGESTDGVIGLAQECPGHSEYTYKPYGQVLIGRDFIERYKKVNNQVWCPDYLHFYPDQEMYEYASSLGKFKLAETAVLKHYHPAFIFSEMDKTHPIVRGDILKKDRDTFARRQIRGLVWGKSFERVNKHTLDEIYSNGSYQGD